MSEVVPVDNGDTIGVTWFDYFSFGHIIMGIAAFIITYFIASLTSTIIPYSLLGFVIAFLFGWFWEVLENNFLWEIGKKFENKKDSLNNSLSDQMFVMIGAILIWIVQAIFIYVGIEIYWLYISALIAVIIFLILFFIVRAVHYKHHPKK